MQLSVYQRDTARLLRDRENLMVPLDELTDHINEARNDVARVTGCLRTLIAGNAPWGSGATPGLGVPGAIVPGVADTSITTFATLPNVERYHFKMAIPWLKASKRGFGPVIDVTAVAVSWGPSPASARPTMEWYSFEELQALGRIYSNAVFSFPFACATQGDGVNQEIFLFPVPSMALEMEWDAACIPTPLNTDGDYDAIPSPFDAAVKYHAAALSFLSTQRYGAADLMDTRFAEHLGLDRAAVGRDRVPSYYDIA